jgi:hypothetical protein
VDLQHRAERRYFVARHIGVPELAVGDLRLAMRVNDEDLRVAGHLRRCRVHVELAKHPADRHVHRRRNFRLLLEEQHAVAEKRGAHLLIGLGVETVRQIDPAHFAAQRRRERRDLNPAAGRGLRCIASSKQGADPPAGILARC